MNLIIFAQFFYPKSGGAYTYLNGILDNLSPNEYKTVYLVIKKNDLQYLKLKNNDLNVVPILNRIPGPRTISFLLFSIIWHKKLSRLFDKSEKNILWNPFNWGCVRKMENFETVTTIHDLHTFTYPTDKGIIKSKINCYLVRYTIKKSDKIIAVSNFTKQELYAHLKDYIRNKPIKVIYESYKTVGINKNDKKLHINDYLFTVSSYRKQKNLEFLLRVFKNLKENYLYSGDLLIGGNIPKKYKDRLVNDCLKLGIMENVIFLGFIKDRDLYSYYKYCDCFLFPSYYEGFGLPIIEASFYGAKICTSDAASLNEFNTTEFKANPFDLHGFSEMVIKAMNSNYTPIYNNYSWQAAANEMLILFKK
jgi:glycosyltransferase involved in cell wall biosynthesis